jgi:ABC-type sugar transport system substrate-binding protein
MDDVVVAGIDAMPDGLAAREAGDLDVTVFQDAKTQGAASVDVALAMLKGEPHEQRTWIPFQLVTPENMSRFKSQ